MTIIVTSWLNHSRKMKYRLLRTVEVVVFSLILSALFTSILVPYFIKKYQLEELSKKHRSHHISFELSEHLRLVWFDIRRNSQRPNDTVYNLNVTGSDNLSFDRTIPTTRHAACESVVYDREELPTLCAVIPVYNEPLSLLFRTVHSILNRTPKELLSEIVLVEDASDYEYLGEPLERYVRLLPKTILVRNSERQGLIRTRLKGLEFCTGEVVIFQDAHTEVNEGWAEPLLYHLKRHPNHLAQPGVDTISPTTLDYGSGLNEERNCRTCTFTWDLRYAWTKAPKRVLEMRRSYADPWPSPQIVGCMIAVDRQYFEKIGTFDENMDIWGGENLEISFRFWQCGGAVMNIPCSRIGHVFKPIPYTFGNSTPQQVVSHNLARVADIWLDSYSDYYYRAVWTNPERRFNFTANFTREIQLRRQMTRDELHCKPFGWYMAKVAPEVDLPPPWAVWYGEVMNMKSKRCLRVLPCGHIGLTPSECNIFSTHPEIHFAISTRGTLHFIADEDVCVEIEEDTRLLKTAACSEPGVKESQFYIVENLKLGHLMADVDGEELCATHITYLGQDKHFHVKDQLVKMTHCEKDHPWQVWTFTYMFEQEGNGNTDLVY